jgi:hypothetical protein
LLTDLLYRIRSLIIDHCLCSVRLSRRRWSGVVLGRPLLTKLVVARDSACGADNSLTPPVHPHETRSSVTGWNSRRDFIKDSLKKVADRKKRGGEKFAATLVDRALTSSAWIVTSVAHGHAVSPRREH